MKITGKVMERYAMLLHIAGWSAFLLLPYFFFPFNLSGVFGKELIIFILTNLANDVIQITFFYINLKRITPLALRKNNILPLIWGIMVCVILIIFFHWLSTAFLADLMPSPRGFPPLPHVPMEGHSRTIIKVRNTFPIGHILSLLLIAGASSGIALWKDLMKAKERQQQMEVEKLTSELAILKLQIGPHFLFNILNNICWLARKKSDLTEDAVISLSEILRYILYQKDTDKVPLEQDIKHLRNYINLQSMRVAEPNSVEFICEGVMENLKIQPLLFIPFVENAFKHGLHSNHKSTILIELKISDGMITFFTSNPVFLDHEEKENEDSGIGIQNVKRRLELHYPGSHQLIIDKKNDSFEVTMKIELNK